MQLNWGLTARKWGARLELRNWVCTPRQGKTLGSFSAFSLLCALTWMFFRLQFPPDSKKYTCLLATCLIWE